MSETISTPQVGDRFITGQGEVRVVYRVYKTGRFRFSDGSAQFRMLPDGRCEQAAASAFGRRPTYEPYSEELEARWGLVRRLDAARRKLSVAASAVEHSTRSCDGHGAIRDKDVVELEALAATVLDLADNIVESIRDHRALSDRRTATYRKPLNPKD